MARSVCILWLNRATKVAVNITCGLKCGALLSATAQAATTKASVVPISGIIYSNAFSVVAEVYVRPTITYKVPIVEIIMNKLVIWIVHQFLMGFNFCGKCLVRR